MGQSEQSDKELEQLLEIAKSKATVDDSEKIDDIGEFILANNIKPSVTEWSDAQSVYWIYRKWCIANDIKPKSRVPFHKIFKKRFNHKMLWTGMGGYGLEDKKRFELTQDEWFQMRKQFRDEKVKKAKKRRKVSRSES